MLLNQILFRCFYLNIIHSDSLMPKKNLKVVRTLVTSVILCY